MFSASTFMKDVNLLHKSLGVESLRRKVIANNIANANVPHFKRSEVNFESELRRVMDENKQKQGSLVRTNQNHLPLHTKRSIGEIQPRVNLDYTTGYQNNGNNVDPDKEITLAAKNQMRYSLFVKQIDQQFRMLNGVMKPPV